MNKKISLLFILFALLFCHPFIAYANEETARESLTITTTEDFIFFAENCRLDSYSKGLVVNLEADLVFTAENRTAVPLFCGEFNGNGHTISGVVIDSYGSVSGLFRYLSETASIKDLHVVGSVIPKGTASVAGGIVGSNSGIIKNCSFSGTVMATDAVGGIVGQNDQSGVIEACTAAGNISGNHFIGGIAGTNHGIIQDCTNRAMINTEEKQNNVDLSDITIDTLTGSESANTVTDVGGIVGSNEGYVQSCRNEGNVGYYHIGYNIGGIAGRQSGYLAQCHNIGTVSGRKEVGGIAGQLEPAVVIAYSTDTLQILEGQLNTLSMLVTSISANIHSATSGMSEQITMIQGQIESAKNSFSAIVPDPESEEPLPDSLTVSKTIEDLKASLSAIIGSLNSIRSYAENVSLVLSRDVRAMSDTIVSMQQTLGTASENLGGTVADGSDSDTEADLTAKIKGCTNAGIISGDRSCGGIVGAVSFESDLDPEEDVILDGELSLNFAGTYRAVIIDCVNSASVNGKKLCAGGIAGLVTLGLIRSCENTGTLNCPDADYVGGIAGYCDGYIRNCSAKATINATSYAGGIAGKCSTVSDCRTMVRLTAQEYVGMITGMAKELSLLSGNCYLSVDQDVGAVDGISYQHCAEPLEQEAFFALEDLPEFFRQYQISFLHEDGKEEMVTLNTGERLSDSMIPSIPPKSGFHGYWEGLDAVFNFDAQVHAKYQPYQQTIQSDACRDSGRSIILAIGSFPEHSVIQAEPLYDSGVAGFLEGWTVSLPDSTVSIRYLLPENTKDAPLSLMVCNSAGQWEPVEFTVDGSYLVHTPKQNSFSFCLVSATPDYRPYMIAACSIVILAGIFTVCIILHRRKRSVQTNINIAE